MESELTVESFTRKLKDLEAQIQRSQDEVTIMKSNFTKPCEFMERNLGYMEKLMGEFRS